MIRSFLGVGDKAGNGAFVTQGLDSVSCSNPPPRVQISTIGMKTSCPVCKQEGHIAPRGPRWHGTGPNGMQWALSGDINLCGCSPPPVFYAERKMMMRFTSEQVAELMGQRASATISSTSQRNYDEQLRVVSAQTALAGHPYVIETSSGAAHSGFVDASGLLPRVFTGEAETYSVYWGDEALYHHGWK